MMRDPAEFGRHCWSNTAHPPQLTSLHRCHLPYCSYHRIAFRGNSRCQSELRHNHSPLIPIPSTLTCLPHIHPPIILGSFKRLDYAKKFLSKWRACSSSVDLLLQHYFRHNSDKVIPSSQMLSGTR